MRVPKATDLLSVLARISQHLCDIDAENPAQSIDRAALLEKVKAIKGCIHTAFKNPTKPPRNVEALKFSECEALMDVLGIHDFDTVQDMCTAIRGDGEPLVIRAADRSARSYIDDSELSEDALRSLSEAAFRYQIRDDHWNHLVKSHQLHGHRMLMEQVVLRGLLSTQGGRHFGHEAILVVKGKISVEFHDWDPPIKKVLGEGDMVSFNSMLKHIAHNAAPGGGESHLVVCKTMMAREIEKRILKSICHAMVTPRHGGHPDSEHRAKSDPSAHNAKRSPNGAHPDPENRDRPPSASAAETKASAS